MPDAVVSPITGAKSLNNSCGIGFRNAPICTLKTKPFGNLSFIGIGFFLL